MVDHQSDRAPSQERTSEATTTQADVYVDDARTVDRYRYRTDDIAYARQAYEARARGDISYAQYRNILLDLHYADPFRFNLTSLTLSDPLFSPLVSHARFSASITFGRTFGRAWYQPRSFHWHRPYFSPFYYPGMHYSIHYHYYGPGSYYHPRSPRYVFAHAGHYGYRPYNISRPYAIQRGSTFGARSSTIASGRIGTEGRVVSPGTTSGRVGTQGRVPATTATQSGDSNTRTGTAGRVSSDSNANGRVVESSRIPTRLDAPERRATQTRGTARTTRDRGNARTNTDRTRTTRDRGNSSTSRDRGSSTRSDRGNSSRTRSSGNNSRTSSGNSSRTNNDRSRGSSSRGSSSRGGGN